MMKLDRLSVEWAIQSLDKHGDTDLFPKPIELKVIGSLASAIDKISDIDISNYQPGPPRRFIVPKEDLSYRATTQLDPLDSVILTALIHQFGQHIEDRRRQASEGSVFSYRFAPSSDGDLYQSKDAWNRYWKHCYELSKSHEFALVLDISDFYNQISHHTIENQLISSGFPNQAKEWCRKLLNAVSANISRGGIPIGPHAAHILAEASLIPVDNSLKAMGLRFCRFVDDIVVLADSVMGARKHLFQIAEILDKQQRLQVQNAKTRILARQDFQDYCRKMMEDRPLNDLEMQLLSVINRYSGGDPYRTVYLSEIADEDLRTFQPEVVEKILSDYLALETPDYARLRWFLRRLSQIGHPAAVGYCLKNFDRMTPAVSDLCHYFISVGVSGAAIDRVSIGGELLSLLDNELIESNEYFQMSVLSLFNRDTNLDHISALLQRYRSSSPFLRREIILAAAESGEADWLRELKGDVPTMDPWSKRAFLYAAKQLPAEERRFFLKSVTPGNLLDSLIINWSKA